MVLSSYYNSGGNVKFTAFLKKCTFVFLICIYLTYNDAGIFVRFFEKEYNVEVTSAIVLRRTLAKHDEHKKLQNRRTSVYMSSNGINKYINNEVNDIQTYKHLKKGALNDLDKYRKGFKNRYSKKKGFAKLECYCENKLFEKIDYVDDLAEKMQNNKNAFIKKILSKYGLRFILFALSPFIGLIFPILFGGPKGEQLIPHCGAINHPGHNLIDGKKVSCKLPLNISHNILGPIYVANCVLFYILLILVFLTILYTFKKIIKYERLKSGKGKMKGKEYFNFCKEVFRIV